MDVLSAKARLISLLCLGAAWACGGEARSAARPQPASLEGPEVYLKVDFDSGRHPFTPTEVSEADLIADPDRALSGRSLQIRRAGDGRYIGASAPLRVSGAKDLRIAFVVRAKAVQTVAVNVFDRRRQDNTTPASPARVFDEDWKPVVFAVEDFHYNAAPPDQKIDMETDFASILFHGREDGPEAEIWVDKLAIYRGGDTAPPGAPTAVRGAAAQDGSVDLAWQEPSDNTFAVIYSIHRKSGAGPWQKVGESLRARYRDRPGPAGTLTYRVTAADFENNVSPPSEEVTVVTTVDSPAAAPQPAWVLDRTIYADDIRQVRARGAGKVRPDVFLFAGDSLTAATLYTHVLGSWLGRGLTVRQGVGTVTTAYGADNIKAYLADARPEFAVIMYGTNDQERGVPVSEATRNLAAIIDACVAFGTVPVVATIPPRGFDKGSQQPQAEFNRAVRELGRQKRVPVSYVFEEMMRHDLKQMLYDGIHLNPEAGDDAAGRALRQTMDQVYFALRDRSQ